MNQHPSDSATQRAAEHALIRAVSRQINIELTPQTIRVAESATVQTDGYNANDSVACEAFARIGKMNAGQKRKLGNDILKLLLLERHLKTSIRKIIVLAGNDALASLSRGNLGRPLRYANSVSRCFKQRWQRRLVDLGAAQMRQVMVNPPVSDGEP